MECKFAPHRDSCLFNPLCYANDFPFGLQSHPLQAISF